MLRIVKAHGGFLRVESESGQGTTFEVFLPRARAVVPVQTGDRAKDLPRGNGELLLLADDEKAICDLMKSELESFGYRVLTASNGTDALTLFRRHAGEVSLFITDNAMPVMDGRQSISELRALKPGLPVIFISGEGAAQTLEGITELNKPFALDELLVAIQRSLPPSARV